MFKTSVAGKGKVHIASHLSSGVGLLLEGKVKWVTRVLQLTGLVVYSGSRLHELFMNTSPP